MWVLEEHIDKALALFEEELAVNANVAEFSETNPAIAAFLFSDDGDILTDEEQKYYTFLVSIYWYLLRGFKNQTEKPRETIIDVAENNWERVLNKGSKSFREFLDPVFNSYPETEALAFLEDSLEMESIDFLSPTGRDYIFVMIKSMIDYFLNIK
jgi:hypothetical protein